MQKFILRRICILVPTIFVVLSILFALSRLTPGDPVLYALQASGNQTFETAIDASSYNQASKNLGLDMPLFYFSVIPANVPREIYALEPLQEKFAFELIGEHGDGKGTLRLVQLYDDFNTSSKRMNAETSGIHINLYGTDIQRTSAQIVQMLEEGSSGLADRKEELVAIRNQISNIMVSDLSGASLVPMLVWHGPHNQFHGYIYQILSLDFGVSSIDGQAVWNKVIRAFSWTLVINILAILMGYFFAITIGVYAGWWGGRFDAISSTIFYFIYSIPIFWLGTILIVFCTTSNYSEWLDIFPSAGIWIASSSDSFRTIIARNGGQLILPILVLSTSLMAFIARIIRNSVMEEKEKAYVIHARTKGLTDREILWNHVFKNASFPLITLFASVFPMAISGSIVLEVICNIPGSGRLLFDAIINQDWSVVFGIVLISSFLTITGLLVSDILYRWADPRIKWSGQ